MKRKLIQISKTTQVLSIPTYWLKKNKLKKGDEINLEENNNVLLISKTPIKQKKTTNIDIKILNEELIWLVVDAYYMKGYDEILITTKDQKQKEIFLEIVNYFPGIIIDEDGKNFIKLKNIAIQEEFNLNSMISRIKNLTITIIEDSIEAINTENWETLTNIKKRDYVLNTYVSMAFRELNNNKQDLNVIGLSQYIKLLEILSDKLCDFLKEVGTKKQKDKTIQETLEKIKTLYKNHSILINKFSFETLKKFEEERTNLLQKTKNKNPLLEDIIRLFFDIEEIATAMNIE